MHLATVAVHAGRHPDPATGAITPPIHMSTTFERGVDGEFPSGYVYSRDGNPNRAMLETCLAALEGCSDAVAFASGMAAITTVLESLPADLPRRLLMPDDIYFGVRPLLQSTDLASRFEVEFVDMTDLETIARACDAHRPGLVWIETPSNPRLHLTDISAVAKIAHEVGALVAVDNTWATPILQRPTELGADLVIHAVTKYLGGHSDLMIGAVVARQKGAYLENIRSAQVNKGAVPSPFECWLALRGIQSLIPRFDLQCRNAMEVATYLASRTGIAAVHYPGLADHPARALVDRQMRGCGGGMLSFEVEGARSQAMSVAGYLNVITRATSLGGPHSLIEHRASSEGAFTRAPEGLLRLSLGLEHAADLIADLDQALERAGFS